LLPGISLGDSVWPPDYKNVFIDRVERLKRIRQTGNVKVAMEAYYSTRPVEFIEDWCITYDPRNATDSDPNKLTTMPFILFPKQKEFVTFLYSCMLDKENALIEKCRDMGATWLCCAFSVWLWRFVPGASVGWGSRKEALVDKLGDPDSIFEKIRRLIDSLPIELLPEGFDRRLHISYMKISGPITGNGSTISGEAGDNIGRGGRKSIYFKDESAHYERPENIEASLGDNTDVQIDISSVNGTNNVFYRRRQAGVTWPNKMPGKVRVFIFDWRDHPLKTQEWYDARKEKAESEGLMHLFAQEVDRDYTSSVVGVVIPQKWVKAAINAHVKLGIKNEGQNIGALDVADEGVDTSALSIRKGIVLFYLDQWAFAEDVGVSASDALMKCQSNSVTSFQYDSIGIGAGVKAEGNRLMREGGLKGIDIVPWNAGAKVLNPEDNIIPGDNDTPLNKDFYANLKAQGWWNLRMRFEKTYKALEHGLKYPPDELISLSPHLPYLHDLVKELSQPTAGRDGRGKVLINKQPQGATSPNLGDTVMMNYFPILKPGFFA
jgi:phage terminase large subunit